MHFLINEVPDEFLLWLCFSLVMVPAPFLRRALPDKKCTSAIAPSVLLLGISTVRMSQMITKRKPQTTEKKYRGQSNYRELEKSFSLEVKDVDIR